MNQDPELSSGDNALNWEHHWLKIQPFLTDEWQDLSDIVKASGRAKSSVCFALKGAEKGDLVDYKYRPSLTHPSSEYITSYRKRRSRPPAAPSTPDVNETGRGLMRHGGSVIAPQDALIEKTCSRCGGLFKGTGHAHLCPACKQPAPKPETRQREKTLSAREKHVCELVYQCMSNKEIAYKLRLTEGTVKEYLFIIFRKVDIENRVGLALYWSRYSGCLAS